MTHPMTPDDVYRSVGELKLVVYAVAALVVMMMVLKVWETTRIARLLRRVESHLETASAHGRLTDAQRGRTDETLLRVTDVLRATIVVLQKLGVTIQKDDPTEQLQAATVRVTEEIRRVPEKTAELVSKRMDQDYEHNPPSSQKDQS